MTNNSKILPKNEIKQIFDRYYETLVQYVSRFIGLKGECEDLVQDIFIDLWEKENIFSNEVVLKAYLYKTARNKCYNVLKHNKVKDNYATNKIKILEDDSLFLKQILEEEVVRQLHKAINLLPQRKQEIIKLSLKGLRNNEIADTLGIKVQTVKTLKSQSYKILREQFIEFDTLIYFLLMC